MSKLVKLHTLNVVCIILSQYSCKKKTKQKGKQQTKTGNKIVSSADEFSKFCKDKRGYGDALLTAWVTWKEGVTLT